MNRNKFKCQIILVFVSLCQKKQIKPVCRSTKSPNDIKIINFYKISIKSTVFKLQKWHAPKNKSQPTRIFTPVITFVHQRRLQRLQLFASLPSNGSYGEICPLRSHLSSQELLTCSLCHRSLACLIIILDTIYHHDIVKSSHHRHDV